MISLQKTQSLAAIYATEATTSLPSLPLNRAKLIVGTLQLSHNGI